MAGQFVLWRIDPNDRDNFIANFSGSKWSELAHRENTPNGNGGLFPGWTAASRDLINRVRNGSSNLANRNNLPPHRYLQIPGGLPNAAQVNYLRTCYWINDLVRPSDPGFGIVALAPAAVAAWSNGKKVDSLVAQITHGATSIEIYYLGGKEMY
ncbi:MULTISPECIES: hypothetical protein [unclassified Microcoleus]|uniref:hypothetical protein n=1 Tax=unclassified Microcoleus TaxID=2642155 RepID=UPI001D58D33A|nr:MULTISPECIES: hypothetical protein [unclassified Microcoleus]MCC3466240.1 hypothetical protein [Microcoleus sp. PH2017_06_SFM_O_A]MCC3475848.1 hypothetical protein [Microcoleus sp. PH2017_13_LAR_U_A]MCC3488370.1 hypothetical protein [Microcoleus sp. PH2017_14_LAR_D_A]MCC3593487.1 hypothetical protein [Microcoleus sp. PH2017_28_MFU_U_A]MCC3600938.1 hypothetical protein [Microcoleus sp. PH2017_26_ELK_O_A]